MTDQWSVTTSYDHYIIKPSCKAHFIHQHVAIIIITSHHDHIIVQIISYHHLNPLWLITSIYQKLISLSSSSSAYNLTINIMIMTMMMTSQARVGESVGVSIRHALSRARDMALAGCYKPPGIQIYSLAKVVIGFK